MEYQEFLTYIKKCVSDFMGERFQVSLNHVTKNNGVVLDGLVILEKGQNIAPTIYLEPFFESHLRGTDVSDIVKRIAGIYEKNVPGANMDVQFFRDFKMVKKKIVYRLVNYQKNEELLKTVPHRVFLDLAVICYCLVVSEKTGNASILIKNEHLEMWGISEEEMFCEAEENTQRLLFAEIMDIKDVMRELMQEDVRNMIAQLRIGKKERYEKEEQVIDEFSNFLLESMDGQGREEMYILTNHLKINGASCMIYPDVLRNFADRLGTDLYILPSSVHEVMLVPAGNETEPEDLKRTVRDVNRREVDEQEILSDSVYRYDRRTDMIYMI